MLPTFNLKLNSNEQFLALVALIYANRVWKIGEGIVAALRPFCESARKVLQLLRADTTCCARQASHKRQINNV